VGKTCPTKRALDAGDSARFTGIFLALSFFCSQAESTPAPAPCSANASRSAARPNRHDNKERILEMAQKYCGKCGNPVQPKDLFCVKCGSPLGSKNVVADHNESATPVQKQSSKSIPPISPEQQQKTPVASANPSTTDVVIKSGTLLFKCPTCPSNISVPLQNIDPIVGISVLCSSCKYISHVPGIYKTESTPPNTRITGSIRVPIAKLWDWYYEHPFIISLIKNSQATLLYDYGLWAFCGACYHQFPTTVLISFIMSHRANEITFFAQTPDSAGDMNALRNGHCSHCQHKELIVVVSEIPDYVRNIITSKRK